MPLIPTLGRQKKVNLCLYRTSYKTTRVAQRNPVSKKRKEGKIQNTFLFYQNSPNIYIDFVHLFLSNILNK